MEFNWKKGGAIFSPDNNYEWMHSYVSPMSAVEFDSFIRVYLSSRGQADADGNFMSYTSYIDCDKQNPDKVLYIHNKPVLEAGAPGTFDEHGIMVADVINHEGKYYMYYMGWQRSETVPYIIRLGLAISEDGENFTKISAGPVIGLNRFSPYGVGNISILVEDGIFHMWYTRYGEWKRSSVGYRPTYDIRYASSKDGLDWEYGDVCVSPAHDNEAVATPCVRKIDGKYHMWYAYRPTIAASGYGGAYRIGYAVSDDKVNWTRLDRLANIDVSETGWDAEMICAPDVLQTSNDLFLFYCGNHYGEGGFGYARI